MNNMKSDSTEEYILGVIKRNRNSKDWIEKLKVNISKYLYVKLDTGAQCNVLPYKKFKQLNLREDSIKNTQARLSNYSGTKIDVMGKCYLKCETQNGKKSEIEFQIVRCEDNVPAILGLETIEKLGLIERIHIVESEDQYNWFKRNYNDLFTGIGEIRGYMYDIKLKEGATGTIEACRKVPLSLMTPLKQELLKMEQDGIIKKINYPTKFVNSLVIVRKPDGSLRICLDPQRLNENILREHFHIKTFEEIASTMTGAKVFTILDAARAFWQVRLSDESADLTTFNTPFGRYCFLKMPYGINSAPEVFHKCFTDIFGGIEGVEIYIDDILIWGEDRKTHDDRLKRVLDIARENNIKFNLKKCKIGIDEVKYLGHKFSKEGLKLDEDKVKAILSMTTPTNVKELETFLGMITYVSRFIPNLSEKTANLRSLLKKDVIWQWNLEHDEAFNNLKKVLSDKPVLQYFDIKKPIILSVDASKSGLGAVLLQDNLPVAYGSRSLTETQINYAQIEKETLAIVFGCEKFHHYLYGNKFTVESDHKPLETIFKKPLNKCPLRLQRMRIRLQPYNFEIKYKPGKELVIADALSRSYLEETSDPFEEEIEAHVGIVNSKVVMSPEKEKLFLDATRNDEELQIVLNLIRTGWPNNKVEVPEEAKIYFHFKEELSEINGLIYKNSCVLVPKGLRKMMLDRIHYNHMGIEKCKNRAREVLFWPGMNKEIEDLISNCSTCLKYQKHNSKEPLMPKEVPFRPWETLGTDLFYLNGKHYLIVIDYFSKFVEIGHLQEVTSTNTIKLLKSIFARNGIPKLLYSDNGPQYNSREFRKFVKEWNFEHKTSSPEYPQSNGLAERYIQTVKNMLLKAESDCKDQYLVLLEYRNTPIAYNLPSPSEILYRRKINGLLPIKESLDQINKNLEIRNTLMDKQKMQKYYFDKGSRQLNPLNEGDNVYIFNRGLRPWESAKIISKAERPRSYKILKSDGRVIERNRRGIIKGPADMKFEIRKPHSTEKIENTDETWNALQSDVPDNNNSDVNKSHSTTANSDQVHKQVFTRSGRLVRKPARFKDFVTH